MKVMTHDGWWLSVLLVIKMSTGDYYKQKDSKKYCWGNPTDKQIYDDVKRESRRELSS